MGKFKSFIALDLKYNTQNISIVKKLHYHVYGFKVGYRSFYNKRSNDLISEIKKHCKVSLEEVIVAEEKVKFKLPKDLN